MPRTEYWRVYLDMDGVVADWHLQAAFTIRKMLRLDNDPIKAAEAFDNGARLEDMLVGSTVLDSFWSRLDHAWWASIPELSQRHDCPDTAGLWRIVTTELVPRSCAFLTAFPRTGASCAASGKMEWLRRAMCDDEFMFAILCPKKAKAELAGPDRLLIDDDETNVERFAKAGGAAIHYRASAANEDAIRQALRTIEPGTVVAL